MFFLATQLFKLMDKYRPEDKQAKKERLKLRAQAKAEGKVMVRLGTLFFFKTSRNDPFKTVLWIRIVLMRIRIRGSASGKTDPDPAHSELFLSFISAVFPSLYFRY